MLEHTLKLSNAFAQDSSRCSSQLSLFDKTEDSIIVLQIESLEVFEQIGLQYKRVFDAALWGLITFVSASKIT